MKVLKLGLRRLYPWLITLLVFGVLWEFCLFALTKYRSVPINFPSYSWASTEGFWFDIDKNFGVWHKPNMSFFHKKGCFNVKYTSNSYGARDTERSEHSQDARVVVIGDSFVEGFGVDLDHRFTNLLEGRTGLPHLNFGTAGDFGTIQQALLYESLAMKFAHDMVIVGLLPINDFLEDDIEVGKRRYTGRYRPYYLGAYPDYTVSYFGKRLDSKSVMRDSNMEATVRGGLREFTFTYNYLSYVNGLLAYDETSTYSGYYDYTNDQFLRARFSIEKIHRLASQSGKKVLLFTIPVFADFLRFRSHYPSQPPLHLELRKLSKNIGFEYIDLLPQMYEMGNDWREFFHTCDGHWNDFGHKTAMEILLSTSDLYKN